MPNIHPSSELRNNYAGLMKTCREQQEPIFLTVNGRGDSVIMPIETYQQMQNIITVQKMLAEAEDDVRNGCMRPAEDVYNDIIRDLQARKSQAK